MARSNDSGPFNRFGSSEFDLENILPIASSVPEAVSPFGIFESGSKEGKYLFGKYNYVGMDTITHFFKI